jgi:hypothetical protein
MLWFRIEVMHAHAVLFEMLAPSQQGPVYVRLVGDAKAVKIGSEFNLNAAQVQSWLAILEAAKDQMRDPG